MEAEVRLFQQEREGRRLDGRNAEREKLWRKERNKKMRMMIIMMKMETTNQ